ncbi:MAG TPA: tetratricopeptide repeat protein, partial [Candidatus Polarisedimenticolia bacterium]|nr:tetratricopeptide repeat protein [Candidatus Polarisedimenticolia bacterium]
LILGASVARPAAADSTAARNNEGNRLYEQKRYDEALKLYTDAQAGRPEAPELHYNIGNVLFRKGEYDKAVEEYLRAQAARDPALAEASLFNRGNALMMQGQLQPAVNAYVQALRARPDDADAKRNLELALRLLKEQQKQQQQDQNRKNDQKPPQDQKQGQGTPPPSSQQQQRDKTQQPRQGQMTEDEARRILDALKDEEKEGIRKHAQAAVGEREKPEEDW